MLLSCPGIVASTPITCLSYSPSSLSIRMPKSHLLFLGCDPCSQRAEILSSELLLRPKGYDRSKAVRVAVVCKGSSSMARVPAAKRAQVRTMVREEDECLWLCNFINFCFFAFAPQSTTSAQRRSDLESCRRLSCRASSLRCLKSW